MNQWLFFAAGAVVTLASACNNVGDCPASVTSGASCNGDLLECPYTLESPSPACDGTTVDGGLQTSCVCTKGTWVCPSPVECPAVAAEAGTDDGPGSDDGSGETGNDGESE